VQGVHDGKFREGKEKAGGRVTMTKVLTDAEIAVHKKRIDDMSQIEMANLWRYAQAGHPYFVSGSELSAYFDARFKGFTPEISKAIDRR